MTFRQRFGLAVTPLLLRVVLAVTFLYAGMGKFWGPIELTPEQVASLDAIQADAPSPPASEEPARPPAEDNPPDGETPAPPPAGSGTTTMNPHSEFLTGEQAAQPLLMRVQDGMTATIERVPSTYHVVDLLTIIIDAQATPDDSGRALLPSFMGHGKWPRWIAIAVGVIELVGGVMMVIGLFTRLWALGLAGVMIGALWMTSIGPVVIMNEPGWPSFMPFLPAVQDFSQSAWQTWLWQFALLCVALSVACLGAGRPSLDHFLFAPPRKKHVDTDSSDDAERDDR